ncbi:MAG: hypothetical protein JMDDDDMK_04575 [Acidobacteria bacterium]|nr:hypothetical protein [Acidobacteriota bacterium]
MRAAHRTEMRLLGAFLRQSLVVEFARGFGIEREVELIFPAEFKTGFRERVVTKLRAGMAFRKVSRVRRDLVSDHAVFHVFPVGQAQVLFRRDVTEHRRAEPSDHRCADGRRDVIVAGRDVSSERAERVKRRFVARRKLLVHVLFDQMHRDVAGAFDHHLAIHLPGDLRQFAQRFKFGELGFVVRVCD